MKRILAILIAALVVLPATATAKPDKDKDKGGASVTSTALTNPVAGASATFTLSWTNVCSTSGSGGPFFPTCNSAQLIGYDNGWMQLSFWNRSGINGTFETTSVTAVGIGGVPGVQGDTRGTYWDAGLGGLQIDWSPDTDIPGPTPGDGFRTTGQGAAFCSGIDGNGATTPNCPGGLTTVWGGSFGAGGGAVFYWFVGNAAIAALNPALIRLETHTQSGPGGASTGYICFSDAYVSQSYVTGGEDGATWECGDEPDHPDPPQETVPEPATMTLLASGLAAMAAADRRRRKARQAE